MQIANQKKQSTTHTETQAARKQQEAATAKKQHVLACKTGTRAGYWPAMR